MVWWAHCQDPGRTRCFPGILPPTAVLILQGLGKGEHYQHYLLPVELHDSICSVSAIGKEGRRVIFIQYVHQERHLDLHFPETLPDGALGDELVSLPLLPIQAPCHLHAGGDLVVPKGNTFSCKTATTHTGTITPQYTALIALMLFCSSVNPFGHHDCAIKTDSEVKQKGLVWLYYGREKAWNIWEDSTV